jgi:hypothetical protein
MKNSISLRATAATLSNADVGQMLKKFNFYNKVYPWNADYANDQGDFQGDLHDNLDGTVTDRRTGLMWQQGQAPDYARFEKAQPYIDYLNQIYFSGYQDWRLPTLEELVTLMTPSRENKGLFVSSVFPDKMWFWSCDAGAVDTGRQWAGTAFAWAINFFYGSLFCLEVSNAQDIRAVRSAEVSEKRKFFSDHLLHLGNGEVEWLLENHYHPHAEMITFDQTIRGQEAIGRIIRQTPQLLGKILHISVDHYAESAEIIQFNATVNTEKLGIIRDRGIWYLENGKIRCQVSFPAESDTTGQ